MRQVAIIYNKERPHMSNHMLTPFQMHQQSELPIKRWSKITKRKTIDAREKKTNYNTQL
jgi:hypothetical protein